MPAMVSNSSPLIHLAKIWKLGLLREYYEQIVIPEAVFRECVAEGGDRSEAAMIGNAEWIIVKDVADRNLVKLLKTALDEGESEAIAIALEEKAELVLLDDSDAREKARLYGLRITGVIGVLLRAKKDGKIDSLKDCLSELRQSGFRIRGSLEEHLLREAGEIKRS